MTDTNSKNSWEEWVNSPQKQEGLYTKLIREFAKDKLKDPSGRAQFVTDLRAKWNIDPDLLKEIEKFAGNDPEFDGLEINTSKLNYNSLMRETVSYFSTLTNTRQEIKDIIITEYDILPAELTAKSKEKLEKLDEKQLKDIINSDRSRKKFLQELYWPKNMPLEKSLAWFMKEFDLEKKLNLVPDSHKADFRIAVEKIQLGQKIDTTDIEVLFESGVYNDVEQKKLLQKMIPSMSLLKARELKLIDDKEVRTFKEGIIKKMFDWETMEVQALASQIRDEDLIFATEKLLDDKQYRSKIIDDPLIFEPFVQRYGHFIDEVQEKIDVKSIQKKIDFIEQLSLNPKVSGAEKMQKGAIIEIQQIYLDENWQEQKVKLYGEVTHMDDQGNLKIAERWKNGYDTTISTVGSQKYGDFLWFARDGNGVKKIQPEKINILSSLELREKISNGEIEETSKDSIPLKDDKVVWAQLWKLSNDIEAAQKNIVKEKDRIREELQLARDAGKNNYTDGEIEQEIENHEYIKNLEKELQELREKHAKKHEDLGNIWDLNSQTLEHGLDEIDHDGKQYGFKPGVSFQTKEGLYVVTRIDAVTREVLIDGDGWPEDPISFQDFYKNFKKQEAKRVSNVQNFEELIANAQKWGDDFPKQWKDFIFKNGKIHSKGKDDKTAKSKISYDYLVGPKWDNDQLLKIEEISGDRVTLSFWKIEDEKVEVKGADGKTKKENKETFITYSNKKNKTFHISYLEAYIKRYKLQPRSRDEYKEIWEKDDIKDINKKFHIFSYLFQNLSIMEAVKGWQQFVEQIKEIMSQGQEEHALQFANQYLGKLLPKWGRQELQVRLENSQKKRSEEYIDRLKNVGSDIAVEMIRGYLLDKHGPQYPKEAAVVFMFEKYWVLNAKWLEDLSGTFTWYQALGWKPNDALYNEVKAEVKKESLPFTEEYLVYRLMVEQCRPEWYNGIKRRSKLHKEIKKIRATGKEEEYDTGIRDGWDQRTVQGRVHGGMGELKKNNYPNAVGWLEQVVNKGGPMDVMNKMPFVMAFSGVAYQFEEKTTDQLKWFPKGSRVLMMLRFFSLHSDLDILNEAILRVCRILQAKWDKKYATIGSEAQKLFDNQKTGIGVKDRVNQAEAFYEQYGTDITNIMYMLNTWKVDDTLNQLIFFEKDKPGNEALKRYYEHLHIYIDADTSFENEDLMSDAFKMAGTSGMDINRVTKQMLGMRQWGTFSKHESAPIMVEEIRKEFEATARRQYDPDPVKNRQKKEELLQHRLRWMIAGMLELHGSHPIVLESYNSPAWAFQVLNKWWVYLKDFIELPGGANYEDLLHWHDHKYDHLLEKFASQIIDAELTGVNYTRPDNRSDKQATADSIGESVSQIVWNKSRSDNSTSDSDQFES